MQLPNPRVGNYVGTEATIRQRTDRYGEWLEACVLMLGVSVADDEPWRFTSLVKEQEDR